MHDDIVNIYVVCVNHIRVIEIYSFHVVKRDLSRCRINVTELIVSN